MKELIKRFNNYYKKFDFKDPHLLLKYHHSYRVMEYCKDIAEFLNFTEHEIELSKMIGILHDVGRFKQYTDYKVYDDTKSIDHADLGVTIIEEENILEGLNLTDKEKSIILLSVKYHNKYSIEDITDEETLKYVKLIRDADKLDIFIEQINEIKDGSNIIKADILKYLINKQQVHDVDISTKLDYLLREIGFIFDLNYDYAIKYLYEKEYISKKIKLLEDNCIDKESINKIKESINSFLKERNIINEKN